MNTDNARLKQAKEDEAHTDALERFALQKTSRGFGGLSADQTALYADIISAVEYTHRLEEERDEALALLAAFVDDQPCVFDHDGLCQTHFLGERPCENERARDLLARSS